MRSLRWSDGRVAGVELKVSHLGARLVVGADGRKSMVAEAVGAEAFSWSPPLTCVYYSYWSGLELRAPAYYMRRGRLILRWPTNDGLTCLYVGCPRSEFLEFRQDIEGNFERSLELVPRLREEVAAGRREERFRGAADLPNYYRASFGDGWALAGDAGQHKDPATGFGMSDAFVGADLLAEAVDEALGGARSWPEALARYQRRRDESTASSFQLTLASASLAPLSPPLERYFEAASQSSAEVTRILGVLGGVVPSREVFSRAHIEAFMGGTAETSPPGRSDIAAGLAAVHRQADTGDQGSPV